MLENAIIFIDDYDDVFQQMALKSSTRRKRTDVHKLYYNSSSFLYIISISSTSKRNFLYIILMDSVWNLLGNPSFLVGVKCGVLTTLAFYYLTSRQSSNAGKKKENEVYAQYNWII